jgi:hypothetical protein
MIVLGFVILERHGRPAISSQPSAISLMAER